MSDTAQTTEATEDAAPLDTAHYNADERPHDAPHDTVCANCGCLAAEHTPGRYSPYGICPAGMLRVSAAQRGSSFHDLPLTEDVRRNRNGDTPDEDDRPDAYQLD